MVTSLSLFELIQSLSKSEKRYFRVYFAGIGKEREYRYLFLFRETEKQAKYDEGAILEKANDPKFARNISSIKNYLYRQILKGLELYHRGSSAKDSLQEAIRHLDILYRKSLHSHCRKILERAIKTARRHESFTRLHELINFERKFKHLSLSGDKLRKYLSASFEEEQKLFEAQRQLSAYQRLTLQTFDLIKHRGLVRSGKEMKEYRQILRDPLLLNEKAALSCSARIHFYKIYGSYYYATGDSMRCYTYRKKMFDLLATLPHLMNEDPDMYISEMNNLLISCLQIRRYNEFFPLLKKLRGIPARNPHNRAHIFSVSYINESNYYLDTGNFMKAGPVITAIEGGLKEMEGKMDASSRLTLFYNIAYLRLGRQEYTPALSFVQAILQDRDKDLRQDLQAFARLLLIIMHFEMKHYDMLEYLVLSAYRYFYKRKHLYRFETTVLRFIRSRLPKITSEQKLIGEFSSLRRELAEISRDPYEKQALEYFDFISWLESKVSGIPFAEIIMKKVTGVRQRSQFESRQKA